MKASLKKNSKITLITIMITVMLAACSSNDGSNNGNTAPVSNNSNQTKGNTDSPTSEPYNLTIALPILGAIPSDMEEVEAEMNKITQSEINTTIDILPISIGAWTQQTNLMTSSGEKLDLLFEFGQAYPHDVARGKILEMNELLEQYGQGIVEAIGEKFLGAAKVSGEIYGVPYYTAYGTQSMIVMRTDLVEKHNIDINAIKSIEDLGPIYETIKQNEPGIVPLSAGLSTPLEHYRDYDRLGDRTGVLPGYDNGLQVVNLYETGEYAQDVELMHQWFKAGYINKDAATTQNTVQQMMQTNKAFSNFFSDKPGQMAGEILATGKELVGVKLLPDIYSTTNDVISGLWSIAAQSENPERAMMMLNLLYTNKELANLFVWGIEGKHYVKVSDTQIDYPEGVDKSNVGYGISEWMCGNQAIIYVCKPAAADLREQVAVFNETVNPSEALGFAFYAETVKNEITAINNVVGQYRKLLETGTVDPNRELAEFNDKMRAAGLEKVCADKQIQLGEGVAAS